MNHRFVYHFIFSIKLNRFEHLSPLESIERAPRQLFGKLLHHQQLDTCTAYVTVKRNGVAGTSNVPIFAVIFYPVVTQDLNTFMPANAPNYTLTIRGQAFPRAGEQYSATISFSPCGLNVPCSSYKNFVSGSSFDCVFDTPNFLTGCDPFAVVQRLDFTAPAVQIGVGTSDPLLESQQLTSASLPGFLSNAAAPVNILLKGWNLPTGTVNSAIAFSNSGTCESFFTSLVNYGTCNVSLSTQQPRLLNCTLSSVNTAQTARSTTPPSGDKLDGCYALCTDFRFKLS